MSLEEYIEQFQWRVLQDAFNEATPAYWERRAAAFDRVNTPTCREIAQACRNKARLVRWEVAA